ncbi:MAG TPA: hypothetical protein VLT58_08525 [Polyangia bacterium]|nr:hypothetical protein [Polyangia bacterium]
MRSEREGDVAPGLMARYCAGEVRAFRDLYDLLAPLVLADLAAQGFDGDTANRHLEAAFLALHRDRSAYVRGADPRPWVIALGRRAAVEAGRRPRVAPVPPAAPATHDRLTVPA